MISTLLGTFASKFMRAAHLVNGFTLQELGLFRATFF
jgi:hypothetical protein